MQMTHAFASMGEGGERALTHTHTSDLARRQREAAARECSTLLGGPAAIHDVGAAGHLLGEGGGEEGNEVAEVLGGSELL